MRAKLEHAVTQFDRRKANRKGYNPYALAQYLYAVDRIIDLISGGMEPTEAITQETNDRLRDCLLKAIKER